MKFRPAHRRPFSFPRPAHAVIKIHGAENKPWTARRSARRSVVLWLLSFCLFWNAPPCQGDTIRWVDLTVTKEALRDVVEADIASHQDESETSVEFVEALACLATRYGGDFRRYRKADLTDLVNARAEGKGYREIAANEKLYRYYEEAYRAVFGGLLGPYDEVTENDAGEPVTKRRYGVCLCSPIARGFSYGHYDDFGAARSYGYRREHLGHDLMGSVGTPIVAVESGYVEACGWNRFGGWRVGIRSFDGKRYYYYAHLRKDHPYNDLYEGKIVYAGEVIGYLGMTGYSTKENVNNIDVPHLHYGLQLIFDKSQKDGPNQIWLDLYEFTDFLSSYRAATVRENGESRSLTVKIPSYVWD